MTTILVTTASELQNAFAAASDGDRIELAAGNYSAVSLIGQSFASGITITSEDPNNRAVLTDDMLIRNVTGLTVSGIDLHAAQIAKNATVERIKVQSSHNITLSDMDVTGHIPTAAEGLDPNAPGVGRLDVIAGYGLENGLRIKDSSNVTVDTVEFHDLRVAMVMGNVTDSSVTNLDIHDVREGINIFDINNLVIGDSSFYDFAPWKTAGGTADDHPDMIQYWGARSAFGLHGVTISNNVFDQTGDIPTQTIFGHMMNAGTGVTATDFVVTGNTIINGHKNAISISDVTTFDISNNTVLPQPALPDNPDGLRTPAIVLVRVTDGVVNGNTALPAYHGGITTMDSATAAASNVTFSNNTALSTSSWDGLYWRNFLPGGPGGTGTGTGTGTGGTGGTGTGGTGTGGTGTGGTGTGGTGGTGTGGTGTGGTSTDTGTGPIASDDPSVLALLQSYADAGVWVNSGTAGNDTITENAGDDIMMGWTGTDKFVFDMRKDAGPSTDVILDLIFAEGDRIQVLTSTPGTFSDSADPSNTLKVSRSGDSVFIDSIADLKELVADGAVTITDGGTGALLSFAVEPQRYLELSFFDAAYLLQ